MAYAAWLAAVAGQPYRLPSEPEWEWAARRGGRLYPWVGGWDAGRLNSLEGEQRVMGTTPLGAIRTAPRPTASIIWPATFGSGQPPAMWSILIVWRTAWRTRRRLACG
jgi:hypothetical protein